MKFIYLIGISLFLFSCNTSSKDMSKEYWEELIQKTDDTIKLDFQQATKNQNFRINTALYQRAIERNLNFYQRFPTDTFSEVALDKVAALFLQINQESEAVKWRDTLLIKFPNTRNRIGLLELQMNYYDFNQYNKEKINFYLEQLLASKELTEEQRQSYEYRLKHIDLTFEELILLQSQDAEDSVK
ncbi:MAG: hypothetical protein H3C31_06745 [Brumimicrobium sp.]|nr:hypothetical protein [Brumimicrobium sp.]